MKTESFLMEFFRKIGIEKVAWSLRRLHCPVDEDALVLEVGSGGNPYGRANVLLDAYETTRERHWVPLVVDRPMVLGFVEYLPFKDGVFDFVIASHVLEHSSEPEKFLGELQRVAKAGYIEVPDAFLERINPYKDHRLEITAAFNKLIIRKKPSWIVENETVELYEHNVKHLLTTKFLPKHPFAFHVRHYWKNKIEFAIVNPEVNAAWDALPNQGEQKIAAQNIVGLMRSSLLNLSRKLLSQTKRNRDIDLLNIMKCPTCSSYELSRSLNSIDCDKCSVSYAIRGAIPVMHPVFEQQVTKDSLRVLE